MKTLCLLRHAESAALSVPGEDHERPLTPRGESDARNMARHLRNRLGAVDFVLCSTAVRTIQTLECIAPALRDVPLRYERSLYAMTTNAFPPCLETLEETCRTILVVGHNPALHALARALLPAADRSAGAVRLREGYPPAAFSSFALSNAPWRDIVLAPPASAFLEAFVRPCDVDADSTP